MEDFTLQARNGKLEIQLNKGIYIDEAVSLRDAFDSFAETYSDILIDMRSVDYIDSTGLGVLIKMKKKAEEKGGTVYLQNITGPVKNILELTRLHTIFNIQ